ncbi:MAG: SRPBCC family protein [Bacteroidetes bacterium]|nr:SRPBCC family protein [Bacteroidota bacterium]
MRKIICRDFVRLDHETADIFNAVADVNTYKNWWGKKVKVKVLESKPGFIGSKIEIKSSGGKFYCEIVDVIPLRHVVVNYYKGVVRGKGIWIVDCVTDSGCALHYNIDLVPHGIIPRLLSNFMNFPAMHSRTMNGMFENLKLFLEVKK